MNHSGVPGTWNRNLIHLEYPETTSGKPITIQDRYRIYGCMVVLPTRGFSGIILWISWASTVFIQLSNSQNNIEISAILQYSIVIYILFFVCVTINSVWLFYPLADCPPDGWSSMDEPPYRLSGPRIAHRNESLPACKRHPSVRPLVVKPLVHLGQHWSMGSTDPWAALIHAGVLSIWGVRLGWLGRMHPHWSMVLWYPYWGLG